jgi:hypothetical protein
MRSVLGFMVSVLVSVSLALGGMTVAGLVPAFESPALAQKAKTSNNKTSNKTSGQQRGQRSSAPQRTGFEHQQCTVQDPCSTRNQW